MRAIQTILLIIIITQLKTFAQQVSPEQIFTVEETSATFPGGLGKFYEYIYSNLKYPKGISKKKQVGTAYIEFFIKEDGHIDKDSIRAIPISELEKTLPPRLDGTRPEIGDIAEACKHEAIRVISTSPPWKPGSLKGVRRRQKFVIPVKFGK
jgi:hypothetical protein